MFPGWLSGVDDIGGLQEISGVQRASRARTACLLASLLELATPGTGLTTSQLSQQQIVEQNPSCTE